MPRTFFVDPDSGNDANDGLSFATRKKTINSAASTLTAGDEVRIIANPAPVNFGNCTWTQFGSVTLPAGETAGLYNDGAWASPGTGVTIGTNSTTIRKEGANSAVLTVANTYTGSTKIASFSGLSANDLSSYSKINLWFYNSTGTTYFNLSVFSILLCSDANGNTPVYTLRFPSVLAPPAVNLVPITIDNGSNFSLATNINSITLSANRQIHTASTSIAIDNVFASKNIRLDGLISKNSTTDVNTSKPELWWAIRSVTNNTASLEQAFGLANYTTAPSRGYNNATEIAPGYALDPFLLLPTTSTAAAGLNAITTRVGTDSSPIVIGGGWDRTNMTQQISGISWMRVGHATNYIINQATSRNITFNNLGFTRCLEGIRITGSSVTATSGVALNNVHVVAARGSGINILTTSNAYTLSNCSGIQCGAAATDSGISIVAVYNLSAINVIGANSYGYGGEIDTCNAAYLKNNLFFNNTSIGLLYQCNSSLLEGLSCTYNGGNGIYAGNTVGTAAGNRFYNCYFTYNGAIGTNVTSGGITLDNGSNNNRFYNTTVAYNSGGTGVQSGGIVNVGVTNTYFYGLTTTGNRAQTTPVAFRMAPAATDGPAQTFVKDWVYDETNKTLGWLAYDSSNLHSINDNLNDSNHFMYTDNGEIQGTSTSARSPGICWQMNVASTYVGTGTLFRNEQYPLTHKIKSVLCTANVPVSASLWIKRTDDTVNGKFVMQPNQLIGGQQISVNSTPASLTDWERLTIAFTPQQTGFVEFEMQAYSPSYFSTAAPTGILIWDDFNITPATTVAATSGDYAYITQGVVVSTPISASSGSTPIVAAEKSFLFC